jgi:hypothetical protein
VGTGAVLDYQHISGDTADEPNEILVTLRPDADLAAARARLQRIVPIADGGVISFARQISVVPEPSVPVLTVIAVIAGALATANLVAAIPGRTAARTSAPALLRAE